MLLTEPGRLAWVQEQLPEIQPGEVLVRTRASAVSVGSELALYRGNGRTYPRMTGYESVGVVRRCGEDVRGLRPGDLVVGFYGHRTHAIVGEERLIPAPPGASDAVALLAILTCDVAKGIRKVAPADDEAVLITGAGAIGCMALWALRHTGVDEVDVVEPLADRRALALHLGARQAAAAAGEAIYSVGFECSDAPAGFARLQSHMRARGRICILSDGNGAPLYLTRAFHERELSIVGSSDGENYRAHATWFFSQPAAELDSLAAIFDWTVPAASLPTVFEALASGARRAVKVLAEYPDPALP